MTNFFCCEDCFKDLEKIDGESAAVWVDLCAITVKYRRRLLAFKVDHDMDRELKILENANYLTSHETNTEVWIKLNGLEVNNEFEYGFCIEESHPLEDEEEEEV